jgi:hypothetical protein
MTAITTPPPLPANQHVRTAQCTLGFGQPLAVQVAYWIGQPGEVIVEQVRIHGAVLDFAHFSDWTLAQLAHQVRQQLRQVA